MVSARRTAASLAPALVVLAGAAASGCDVLNATTRVGPPEVDSPVAWYPMTDPDHVGRDRSGNRADALPNGVVVVRDAARGNVAHFDGGSLSLQRPVRSDFTITFWIKTQQMGPDQTGWINGPHIINADVPGFHLDFGISLALDKVAFGVGTPMDGPMDMVAMKSARGVVDGTWHHVAVTRDGQTGIRQIFIDGAFDSREVAVPGALRLPPTIMFGGTGEGSLPQPSPPLRADLSDARFYDRVLGDTAIAFLATL